MLVTKETIETAIKDDLGRATIANLVISEEGIVGCILNVGEVANELRDPICRKVEATIRAIDGVKDVNVVMTADRKPQVSAAPRTPPAPTPEKLMGVKHVIAVSSGKGGVGKSTVSVNLALALKAEGLTVGLLDLDIFGPSLPTLLGIEGQKPSLNSDEKIVPLVAHGIKALSIGLMVDQNEPIVWRGPRVMGATKQMLADTAWGPLDVLVIDMPPGTGDVQLSMVQTAVIDGAVIVSTPQDLALIDAKKGIAMFDKVGVKVLGVIENMSHFTCPKCGEEHHIFGHGGARDTADEIGAEFLGEIPLAMAIRESADSGKPIVDADPTSDSATSYLSIAKKIKATLS